MAQCKKSRGRGPSQQHSKSAANPAAASQHQKQASQHQRKQHKSRQQCTGNKQQTTAHAAQQVTGGRQQQGTVSSTVHADQDTHTSTISIATTASQQATATGIHAQHNTNTHSQHIIMHRTHTAKHRQSKISPITQSQQQVNNILKHISSSSTASSNSRGQQTAASPWHISQAASRSSMTATHGSQHKTAWLASKSSW